MNSHGQSSRPLHQILLLRGLTREARHWGDFPDELKRAFEAQGADLRVNLVDLPGAGAHSEMISPPSIDAMADFVRDRFRDQLAQEMEAGLPKATRRSLVTISLGGMIATSWVTRYAHDFNSIVLMNSSLRGLSKPTDRLRVDQWWRIPLILKERDIETRERRILEWISNRPDRRAEVLSDWVKIQLTRPVSTANLAIQLAAAARHKPTKIPSAPALILCGRGDRMVSFSCSESIAQAWGAKILHHPVAGHDLPLDAGGWAATMIAEWNCQNLATSPSKSSSESASP
jgi:alpha-beta hydrolase superfamily lysophospholipase